MYKGTLYKLNTVAWLWGCRGWCRNVSESIGHPLESEDGNPDDAAHWLKRDMWVACDAWL